MPKIVDYEEQKGKIADAALSIIRNGGLRQATVRNIASAAGLSVGFMRHYFPEQEDLIKYVMELIIRQATDRIKSLSFRYTKKTPSLEGAKNALCQLIAVNEQQKTEMEVWLAFCVETFYRTPLKNLNDKMYDSIYNMVYDTLLDLREAGLLRNGLNLHEEAKLFHLLVDGLSLHRVIRPEKLKPLHAEEILRRQFHALAEPGASFTY